MKSKEKIIPRDETRELEKRVGCPVAIIHKDPRRNEIEGARRKFETALLELHHAYDKVRQYASSPEKDAQLPPVAQIFQNAYGSAMKNIAPKILTT